MFHNLAANCQTKSAVDVVDSMKLFNYFHNTSIYAECLDSVEDPFWEPFASLMTQAGIQSDRYCERIKKHPVFGNGEFNILAMS